MSEEWGSQQTTRRRAVEYESEFWCEDCHFHTSARSAVEMSRKHAAKTGHDVRGFRTLEIRFSGKPATLAWRHKCTACGFVVEVLESERRAPENRAYYERRDTMLWPGSYGFVCHDCYNCPKQEEISDVHMQHSEYGATL